MGNGERDNVLRRLGTKARLGFDISRDDVPEVDVCECGPMTRATVGCDCEPVGQRTPSGSVVDEEPQVDSKVDRAAWGSHSLYRGAATMPDALAYPDGPQEAHEEMSKRADLIREVPVEVSKTRVYLSGPMSGYPNFNFAVFNDAAEWLDARGYDVFNPAAQGWGNGDPETGTVGEDEYLEFMREDIRQVASADVIALLPGWENSRGATFELDVARRLGLRVARLVEYHEDWILVYGDTKQVDQPEAPESVLGEADRLVSTDRGAVYGHPLDDFSKVTGMAQALWGRGPETAEEHAIYMVLVKLARLESTPGHHDSIVDVAGYMKTYDMVIAERARRAA